MLQQSIHTVAANLLPAQLVAGHCTLTAFLQRFDDALGRWTLHPLGIKLIQADCRRTPACRTLTLAGLMLQ